MGNWSENVSTSENRITVKGGFGDENVEGKIGVRRKNNVGFA